MQDPLPLGEVAKHAEGDRVRAILYEPVPPPLNTLSSEFIIFAR